MAKRETTGGDVLRRPCHDRQCTNGDDYSQPSAGRHHDRGILRSLSGITLDRVPLQQQARIDMQDLLDVMIQQIRGEL